MSHILYNKSFESDEKNINLIINFFEDYKLHLRKKEYMIFKENIPVLINFLSSFERKLMSEIEHFKKSDSDVEENYPDEYKNCEAEDSISEYDTDTDDENTITYRKKLVVKSSQIKNRYELCKLKLPIRFKKID
jgi:hypothetical protein